MALPPLRSTAASERTSLIYSPTPLPSSEGLRLPVVAATSLRPARPRRRSPSPQLSLFQQETADVEDGTRHPLLDALLQHTQASTHTSESELSSLPAVAEAIDEIGGAARMEVLLQRLRDDPQLGSELGCSSPTTESAVDAVTRCVESTLHLPASAVHTQCARDDPSVLNVHIPLREHAAEKRRKGGVTLRPYLLLRVHPCRGVVSLHVVNVCFDGASEFTRSAGSRRRLRQSGVERKPRSKKKMLTAPASDGKSRTSELFEVGSSGLYEGPSNVSVSGSAAKSFAPPTEGLGYHELCSLLRTSASAANSADNEGDITNQHIHPIINNNNSDDASRISSVQRDSVDTSRRTRSKPKAHSRRSTAQKAEAGRREVEFDPLHPEETTPFNSEHRPLTFNAAIVFAPASQ